jgi:sugar lactone lactonase YvrE
MTLDQWHEMERLRLRRTRRALVILLIVLVALLGGATAALVRVAQPVGRVADTTDAAGMKWVRSIYGWGNTKAEQLNGPQGVAIGPDGVIWATDQAYSRVIGFRPDGSYAGMLFSGVRNDPASPNAMVFPTSLAVDNDNQIYVGDQAGDAVYVMTRDNKVVRKIQVPTPQAVAVSDDLVVVGSASGFVIMSKDGTPIKVIGRQGKADGEFSAVRGVAIGKDDTIFVVDQYNNRISGYDRDGVRKWIRTMGQAGNAKHVKASKTATDAGGLQLPAQITIDGAGRLVVIDPFAFGMAVLDAADGKILATYGDAGVADGKFTYPSGIAYDSDRDWFAVADTMNQRVQVVTIPDSGGSVTAGIRRGLSGPLRALLLPLLLLILAIITATWWALSSRRKSRAPESQAA